jgi:hypothetical protein
MATKNLWLAGLLAVGMAVGCGGEGGSSGAQPTQQQKSMAQTADAGSSAIELTNEAATDSVVEAGAPGSTSAKTGSSKSYAAGTTINYQATVNVTVDLDVLNGQGQDAFPNATGKFSVVANGAVTGNGMNGTVTYDVTVTWVTDGVFTDPVSGDVATVASGSNWTYDLAIQWTKVDDLNWSIQATSDVSGSLNATVLHEGKTWTVTGTVARHAAAAFSRTAGNWAWSFGVNGSRTLVVTDGTETHTVVVTMSALDHVTIEVDGVVYGPYTAFQVWMWWHFDCNH